MMGFLSRKNDMRQRLKGPVEEVGVCKGVGELGGEQRIEGLSRPD